MILLKFSITLMIFSLLAIPVFSYLKESIEMSNYNCKFVYFSLQFYEFFLSSASVCVCGGVGDHMTQPFWSWYLSKMNEILGLKVMNIKIPSSFICNSLKPGAAQMSIGR